MRVTAGLYKGRKVNPIHDPAIRPSKAMVREALFSILGVDFCRDAVVADLFSGSGIMAIESLSRGCGTVYCVDSSLDSCRLIRANMEKLEIDATGRIFHLKADQAVSSFAAMQLKFDLLFLDPPYAAPQVGITALELACSHDILTPESVAVFEHNSRFDLPEIKGMSVYKQRRYGHTKLTFLRPE